MPCCMSLYHSCATHWMWWVSLRERWHLAMSGKDTLTQWPWFTETEDRQRAWIISQDMRFCAAEWLLLNTSHLGHPCCWNPARWCVGASGPDSCENNPSGAEGTDCRSSEGFHMYWWVWDYKWTVSRLKLKILNRVPLAAKLPSRMLWGSHQKWYQWYAWFFLLSKWDTHFMHEFCSLHFENCRGDTVECWLCSWSAKLVRWFY